MITPSRTYIIWFTQRVGSTLLCQALEDTGLAGKPREWFNVPDAEALLARHGVSSAQALRDELWGLGTGDNGVFGLKYGLVTGLHRSLTDLMGQLEGAQNADDAWDMMFPNCAHIFMTRRHKVRLAVSWWRAICSAQWHRRSDVPPTEADLEGSYDFNAIDHLHTEIGLRESALQEHFTRRGIVPLTLVYEDFIARYEPTVRRVLDEIGVADHARVEVPAPAFAKLADGLSESWVQRYRVERQEGWASSVW